MDGIRACFHLLELNVVEEKFLLHSCYFICYSLISVTASFSEN